MNVDEIKSAILRLSLEEAETLQDWLEQWLEDRQQMTPEFLESIERGRADLTRGCFRKVIS